MARSKKKLKLQKPSSIFSYRYMTLLILNLWKCIFILWRMHPFQKIRKKYDNKIKETTWTGENNS